MKALVPIKRFRDAKQRLAAAAHGELRERLARAMAEHVLGELARSQTLREVVVVSAEPELPTLAERLGFRVIIDRETDLNASLQTAADRLAWTSEDVVIVHADLPLFSQREFDRVAILHRAGPSQLLTLVPDSAALGTNLRFSRPGFLIPMLFGERSAEQHTRAAADQGLAVTSIAHSPLSLDCDRVSDVRRILDHPQGAQMPERLRALLGMIDAAAPAIQDIAS